MEGRAFGNVPLQLELKLEVWDSPNSAGVMIDAVRCVKLALDRGIGGPLIAPSSYFMKSPPQQFTDDKARRMMEEFITGESEPSETPATVDEGPSVAEPVLQGDDGQS
jgi:myo-inositol-1-phosphate synthase